MNTIVDRTSHRLRRPAVALAGLALIVPLAACGDDGNDDAGSDGGSVTIEDVWIREQAAGQANTAAYALVTNETGEEITLVGAATPVTDRVEIHETMMDDEGVMSMQEREGGFVIAAGETLTMEPGGAHVMMFDVDPAELGDGTEITFEFDGADSQTLPAEVRPLDGEMGDMGHSDMDTEEMDMEEMDGESEMEMDDDS